MEAYITSEPVSVTRHHHLIRVGEWILFVLLAGYLGLRTLPRAWHTLNTDFPNYYLTARLTREHFDTSRVYEWTWIQRQKDHRQIDQRIVGLVPITPFSTLVLWPLASMPPLAAKHYWLILNLTLLFATASVLRSLTQLPWRRIALVASLSFPLHINLLLGQYYVLLLFSLTLACWLYVRQRRFLAGIMVGFASALKIFPVLYLVYFLRKKDLKAFFGGITGCVGAAAASLLGFGWPLHRTYITQILPATLRGEALDPFNLKAASLSSLLHRLFIFEPQLNPHPALHAPWLFAVLQPVLQMAILAPALLFAIPKDTTPRTLRLEWAAILLAALAISTSLASYHFTLLILPACILWSSLREYPNRLPVAAMLALYAIIGILTATNDGGSGWNPLLAVPRLYAVLLLCAIVYALLLRHQSLASSKRGRSAWTTALVIIAVSEASSNLDHQRDLYADHQWRIPTPKNVYMAAHPAVQGDRLLFITMLQDGYHAATERFGATTFSSPTNADYLAVTASNDEAWLEHTANQSSIVPELAQARAIRNAESPAASFDGQWLAFLRDDRGRGRLWVRALRQPGATDKLLTPPELNVLEMSFLPDGTLIFSADPGDHPQLFTTDQAGNIKPLETANARYPAVSPNGHWLAYSQLQSGNWNLWLRNLDTGQVHRLSNVPCNNMQPAWTADSQSLIYASDCGRALWFTALCKRRVFPLASSFALMAATPSPASSSPFARTAPEVASLPPQPPPGSAPHSYRSTHSPRPPE